MARKRPRVGVKAGSTTSWANWSSAWGMKPCGRRQAAAVGARWLAGGRVRRGARRAAARPAPPPLPVPAAAAHRSRHVDAFRQDDEEQGGQQAHHRVLGLLLRRQRPAAIHLVAHRGDDGGALLGAGRGRLEAGTGLALLAPQLQRAGGGGRGATREGAAMAGCSCPERRVGKRFIGATLTLQRASPAASRPHQLLRCNRFFVCRRCRRAALPLLFRPGHQQPPTQALQIGNGQAQQVLVSWAFTWRRPLPHHPLACSA